MPLEDLVELHGGMMLKTFAQKDYSEANKFGPDLDRGVCSALSTTWISRRAQGKDFFKYLDSVDGRHQVAMLQGRERGVGNLAQALGSEGTKFPQRAAQMMKAYQGSELQQKLDELAKDAERLKESGLFLKDQAHKQHQFRVDYIKQQTGLTGNIDKLTSQNAVRAFALQERYVIFGMNGESGGHAVALFEGRDGVRFYDPNLGEAFFEDREKFQGFLSEFVSYYSKAGLGSMKNIEITDFACSLMPKSPEDAELREHGYLPLNLSFPECMESGTREELTKS